MIISSTISQDIVSGLTCSSLPLILLQVAAASDMENTVEPHRHWAGREELRIEVQEDPNSVVAAWCFMGSEGEPFATVWPASVQHIH